MDYCSQSQHGACTSLCTHVPLLILAIAYKAFRFSMGELGEASRNSYQKRNSMPSLGDCCGRSILGKTFLEKALRCSCWGR